MRIDADHYPHYRAPLFGNCGNLWCIFEIVGTVADIETIAVGGRIREIMRLRRQYGSGRWRKMKGMASVQLSTGSIRNAEVHWYEAHGVGRVKMRDQAVSGLIDMQEMFALCIENRDCADLEKRKVYQIVPDEKAAREGYIRVIDESREDYLYPTSYFVIVNVPQHAHVSLLNVD